MMKLYHFTRKSYLPSIAEHGLWKGDMIIDANTGINAVNLTTSKSPEGHGLEIGPDIDEVFIDGHLLYLSKKRIRFEVTIPSTDRNLIKYSKWAKKYMTDDEIREHFDKIYATKTWWIYFGIIPPEALRCYEMKEQRYIDFVEEAKFIYGTIGFNPYVQRTLNEPRTTEALH
jgi:hypothetical protein